MLTNHKIFSGKQVRFLDFLFEISQKRGNENISIDFLCKELALSASSVRELLVLAKSLGLVEIQPRNGIKILPYRFAPTVKKSVYCAVRLNSTNFDQFFELRNKLESAYFLEAVHQLKDENKREIIKISEDAIYLLNESNPRVPYNQHRDFHLTIYRNLDNIFVKGILESFWDLYEIVGLNLYEDLDYLKNVWNHHHEIAKLILAHQDNKAYQILLAHMDLIYSRTG